MQEPLEGIVDDAQADPTPAKEAKYLTETETPYGSVEESAFQAETAKLLEIVAKSLYTDKEVRSSQVCRADHRVTVSSRCSCVSWCLSLLMPSKSFVSSPSLKAEVCFDCTFLYALQPPESYIQESTLEN